MKIGFAQINPTVGDLATSAPSGPVESTEVTSTLRYDPTPSGFVLEFEEEWDERGDHWYCREIVRADVRDGAICQLSAYCTGDWDSAQVARHQAEVRLIQP